MEKILQEKISADHLFYVSLKYTKTTDVILNLLEKWKNIIEISLEKLLEKAKKKNIIKNIPHVPKMKIDVCKKIFKKNTNIIEAINLLEFLKKIPVIEKIRENEFRKNVAVKILHKGEWITIDIEKLEEYNEIIERFIREVKQFL
ncbi:MAG: hypothetical protein QW117_00310 [Candidatus Pacearchaeota archaeon]